MVKKQERKAQAKRPTPNKFPDSYTQWSKLYTELYESTEKMKREVEKNEEQMRAIGKHLVALDRIFLPNL